MNWIELFSSVSAGRRQFPICEILRDSLYYPASGHDGSVIRQWALGVESFVYADTSTDQTSLNSIINDHDTCIAGYRVFALPRSVHKDELCPNGWIPQPPPGLDPLRYREWARKAGASATTAFAQWTIFERKRSRPKTHGPKHFSLLFIRGEGAATYQALYGSNEVLPRYVAVIRPGEGYGGNYPRFEQILFETMSTHRQGMPEYLLHWGHVDDEPLPQPWVRFYDGKSQRVMDKDREPQFRIYLYSRRAGS